MVVEEAGRNKVCFMQNIFLIIQFYGDPGEWAFYLLRLAIQFFMPADVPKGGFGKVEGGIMDWLTNQMSPNQI